MRKLLTTSRSRVLLHISLFGLILGLAFAAIFFLSEKTGLALTELPRTPVRTMAANTQTDKLYAILNSSLNGNGIYTSADNGRSWQFTGPAPDGTINVLAVHPANESVLLAGTPGGPMDSTNNLWRSNDAGQTWHKVALRLPARPDGTLTGVTAISVDPNQPDVFYVGTDGQGVYRFDTSTNGYGYSRVGGIAAYNNHVKQLAVAEDNQLYILTDDGLFKASGDNWNKLNALPETPISMAVAATQPSTLYVVASSSTVYRSVDGGNTWHTIGGNWWKIPEATLLSTALAIDPQNKDHIVVATAYKFNNNQLVGGSIYETQDAGQTWVKVTDAYGIIHQLIINGQAIYAATDSGLIIQYRGATQDAGSSGWLWPDSLSDLFNR